MMGRAPSLREVRAADHANVAILPTAAPRQVRQNRNQVARRSGADLRRNHASRFAYEHPHQRAANKVAKALHTIERSAAYDVLDAMLRLMGEQFRYQIANHLMFKHLDHPNDLQAAQAYWFVQRYDLNYGDASTIRRALARLDGDAE